MQAYPHGSSGPHPPPRPTSSMNPQFGQNGAPYGYPQSGSIPPGPQYYNISNPPPQPSWTNTPQPPAQHYQQWNSPGPPPSSSFTSQTAPVYNPNTYGPMPGTPNAPPHYQTPNHSGALMDTTRWGVKYNQPQLYGDQFTDPKPPLPPRPTSASSQSQAGTISPQEFPTPQNQFTSLAGPMVENTQPWAHNASQDTFPTSSIAGAPPVPPPPPPLPEGYQQELRQHQQNWPQHSQYSHHAPTHQYDPQTPGYGQTQIVYGQGQTHGFLYQSHNYRSSDHSMHDSAQGIPPSVSPIEQSSSFQWSNNKDNSRPQDVSPPPSSHANLPDHVTTILGAGTLPGQGGTTSQPVSRPSSVFQGAITPHPVPSSSALGFGGPSAWEHFSPAGESSSDTWTDNRQESNLVELASEPPHFIPPGDRVPDSRQEHLEVSDAPLAPLQPCQNSSVTTKISTILPSRDSSSPSERPIRVNSLASVSTTATVEDQGGNIDGVIQAWSNTVKPNDSSTRVEIRDRDLDVQPKNMPHLESRMVHGASLLGTTKTQSNDGPSDEMPKKTAHIVDPYGDLEPEYRASLARFVSMLRKESAATTDEGKYKVFKAFQIRETKLREILYCIESSGLDAPRSKDMMAVEKSSERNQKESSTMIPVGSQSIPLHHNASLSPTQERVNEPSIKKDGTVFGQAILDKEADTVAGELDDDPQYSPGGRPIVKRRQFPVTGDQQQFSGREERSLSLKTTTPPVTQQPPKSPGADAPIVIESQGLSRTSSVPPAFVTVDTKSQGPVSASTMPKPQLPVLETNKPAYAPFRYVEGPQRGSEELKFDRPAFQAYTNLRQASVDSGRAMAHATSRTAAKRCETLDSPSTTRRQHEETFLGLIRETATAKEEPAVSPIPKVIPKGVEEHDTKKKQEPEEALRSVIPSHPMVNKLENKQIVRIRVQTEQLPDEFSFIHKAVVEWDSNYKAERLRLEKERHQRQEESEQKIDVLFNDNEIGYSDIGNLEETFRREEADKKLLEDRRELESFNTNVFDVVDGRLNEQIAQLNQLYQDAVELMEGATAGSRMFEANPEHVHVSQAMQMVLNVFRKLDARHQKRVEAVLERERRRRKIELALWYSLGDVSATKKLADEFEYEERLTLYHAAQEKDERANKLMDGFDRAILRGLGENQRLTESLLEKIQAVRNDLKRGASPSSSLRGTLTQTLSLLDALNANSEACLQYFDIADRILNEADYDVSRTQVKLESGDEQTLRKLEREKSLEDAKLQDDLSDRLDSVRKYSGESRTLIQEMFDLFMPSSPSDDKSPATTSSKEDVERQERLKMALDEARRRNAAKE